MPGRCISQMIIFENISAGHLKSASGLSLGWFHVPQMVPKLPTRHAIPGLERWCHHSGILPYLVPAWNGIVLMDFRDYIILFWQPWSGIIQNKSWLLQSHMAHAWYVKFPNVRASGIQLVEHSITQDIGRWTQSFWMKLIWMFCTLFVFIQFATSSGNSLTAMSISFGSLMNCISCSWVKLNTYSTGCSNTWKLEISRINLTINSHQCHDIQASRASLNHSIRLKAATSRAKRSGAWSEHWQWIALQFLSAPRMAGKLRQKQPLMKW